MRCRHQEFTSWFEHEFGSRSFPFKDGMKSFRELPAGLRSLTFTTALADWKKDHPTEARTMTRQRIRRPPANAYPKTRRWLRRAIRREITRGWDELQRQGVQVCRSHAFTLRRGTACYCNICGEARP